MDRIAEGLEAVAASARIISRGGLVAIPTDTVYGLACDPRSDRAVERLFEAKQREAKPVSLLCASTGVAARLVELEGAGERLAKSYWPGALTIVARLRAGNGISSLLDQGTGSLGVRVPDSGFCLDLADRVGGAVTGTSANLSGRPSCRSASQVVEALGGRVDLVVDGGELRGRESTVVRASGTALEVLRGGSVGIPVGELGP